MVKQEGFYPYEYMNDFKNFKEKLPSKEKFHSSLTNRRNTNKKFEHVLYLICHEVFLTFIAMGRGQILSPTVFSWLTNAFVNKSSTFYEQNFMVRYLLTSLFFWWCHHKLKTPTEIPSFLHICMRCLIFAWV